MYSDKIERVGRLERVGSYKHIQIYICSALAANYVVHVGHVKRELGIGQDNASTIYISLLLLPGHASESETQNASMLTQSHHYIIRVRKM